MFSFMRKAGVPMKIHCCERNFGSLPSLLPVELPSRRDTHLWYIVPDEVKSVSLLDQYLELLSPSEKENVFRMRGDQLRKRALLARALVRTTIARYQINSQVTPTTLKFRKDINGKPEVKWKNDDCWSPPPLHFNISHTSSLIACGVNINSPIGIDVEEKHRKTKSNVLSLAHRYFSPPEVELLAGIQDPDVQRQEFLKFWTLKEAYVKALGRGFSAAPFKTFTIQFRPAPKEVLHLSSYEASEIVVESADYPETLTSDWQFRLLELAGSHYASICVKNDKYEGEGGAPIRLTVRRTIPFVEDELVEHTQF